MAVAETITFDKTVFSTPQTINLNPALGQLELSDQTGTETITGPNAGVTINGNYTTAGPANSVFKIDPGVTATLSGLTITGGNNGDYGGGVDNQGTATLIDCTVSGNAGGGFDNFWHGDVHRLHDQRKPSRSSVRRRRSGQRRWLDDTHRLHDQRKLRRLRRRRGMELRQRRRSQAARSAATRQPRAAG